MGTLLLYNAIARLKAAGVKMVGLSSGAENFPAQRIYTKTGFRKTDAFAILKKRT